MWELLVQKVHLLVESDNLCYTFSVELRVLNFPSGVSSFCIPLLVEQVARKGVCVKDNASRGFWTALMLMGERAFLKGPCAASLLSLIVEFTPFLNDSATYKAMLHQSFRKHTGLYQFKFSTLYCQISSKVSHSSIPGRFLYDSHAALLASCSVSLLSLSLTADGAFCKALSIIIFKERCKGFFSVNKN